MAHVWYRIQSLPSPSSGEGKEGGPEGVSAWPMSGIGYRACPPPVRSRGREGGRAGGGQCMAHVWYRIQSLPSPSSVEGKGRREGRRGSVHGPCLV